MSQKTINGEMTLDGKRLRRPLRKLRKTINEFPRNPSPEPVHDLRTRGRALLAMLQALNLDGTRNGKRLLNEVRLIHKKAGKVRDMDVLIRFASQLGVVNQEEETDSLLQLLEYLGAKRSRQSRKLHRAMRRHGHGIKRHLEQTSKFIKSCFQNKKPSKNARKWAVGTMSLALRLERDLTQWPVLDRSNLHPFRLKVKELLYVFELAGEEDTGFAMSLAEVKDTIGEWHDLELLGEIAEEILNQGAQCSLTNLIRAIAEKKLEDAIDLTMRMRSQYLNPNASPGAPLWRWSRAPRLRHRAFPLLEASAS